MSAIYPKSPFDGPVAGNPWERSTSARDQSRANDRRIFSSVLSRAKEDAPADPEQAAREGAENLISVALVQPILAKMRDSAWGVEPFKQTSGQKSFNGMMDNALALKMVRSGNWPLVDKVTDRMLTKLKANQAGKEKKTDTLADDAITGDTLSRQAFEMRAKLNFNADAK